MVSAESHQRFLLHDAYGRSVNYLRLSVTDRCNLRCRYCMPADGVSTCHRDDILSYEHLLSVLKAAISLGIEKVRITGGEPLVRKGIVDFIKRLGDIEGLNEIALTTNGILLDENAASLKKAGVDRLNISLDSLVPHTYSHITRGGDLQRVLAGLSAAEANDFKIKLNMVVMRGVNDREIENFAALSLEKPWSVRFIEYMPTVREKAWENSIMTGEEVLSKLKLSYKMEPLKVSRLCGPARPYKIAGACGTIGVITPMSDHFCSGCNRIRVTSNGLAKSCLLSNEAVDLRPALAKGEAALCRVLEEVVFAKGAQHNFHHNHQGFNMSCIGG